MKKILALITAVFGLFLLVGCDLFSMLPTTQPVDNPDITTTVIDNNSSSTAPTQGNPTTVDEGEKGELANELYVGAMERLIESVEQELRVEVGLVASFSNEDTFEDDTKALNGVEGAATLTLEVDAKNFTVLFDVLLSTEVNVSEKDAEDEEAATIKALLDDKEFHLYLYLADDGTVYVYANEEITTILKLALFSGQGEAGEGDEEPQWMPNLDGALALALDFSSEITALKEQLANASMSDIKAGQLASLAMGALISNGFIDEDFNIDLDNIIKFVLNLVVVQEDPEQEIEESVFDEMLAQVKTLLGSVKTYVDTVVEYGVVKKGTDFSVYANLAKHDFYNDEDFKALVESIQSQDPGHNNKEEYPGDENTHSYSDGSEVGPSKDGNEDSGENDNLTSVLLGLNAEALFNKDFGFKSLALDFDFEMGFENEVDPQNEENDVKSSVMSISAEIDIALTNEVKFVLDTELTFEEVPEEFKNQLIDMIGGLLGSFLPAN